MSDTGDHNRPAEHAEQPAPEAKPVALNNAENPDQTAERRERQQRYTLEWAMVRWTRAVGVFTGFLVVVGAIQVLAFIESERAFLSVVDFRINGDLPKVGSRNVQVLFGVKNGGKNIAFVSYETVSAKVGPLQANPEYGNEPQRPIPPIPPDVVANSSDNILLSAALSQGEIDAMKDESRRLSIFGYITYSDTFWILGNRTNGFCYTYMPVSSGGRTELVTCPERQYTYAK